MNLGEFILVSIIKIVIAIGILLTAVAYTVWLERKVVGHIQNRWGPTRVGPFGLLQPLADGIKFIFKEDLLPPHVFKPLFIAAPMIALIFALTSISVIPIGNWVTVFGIHMPLEITDVYIGLLIVLGVTSLGVYSIALAGWSSNSKYPLFGGLRSSAQMISYELSLGLAVIGTLMFSRPGGTTKWSPCCRYMPPPQVPAHIRPSESAETHQTNKFESPAFSVKCSHLPSRKR